MKPEEIFSAVASALIASADVPLEREEIAPESSLAELGFVRASDCFELCFELEEAFPDSDLDFDESDSWLLVSDVVRACTPGE